MRIVFGSMLGIVSFAALAACGDPMASLRTRSAFDLKCPEKDLTLTELSPCGAWKFGQCTVGVTGCGRQATYLDRGANGTGDWVMNNAATSSEPSGPPAK
ncbi:MAG: hypothetical protein U0169_11255 [Polyangiaceae bacterium]